MENQFNPCVHLFEYEGELFNEREYKVIQILLKEIKLIKEDLETVKLMEINSFTLRLVSILEEKLHFLYDDLYTVTSKYPWDLHYKYI